MDMTPDRAMFVALTDLLIDGEHDSHRPCRRPSCSQWGIEVPIDPYTRCGVQRYPGESPT